MIAKGDLRGTDIYCPVTAPVSFKIDRMTLSAREKTIHFQDSVFTLNDQLLSLEGKVTYSRRALFLELLMTTEALNWDGLRRVLSRGTDDESAWVSDMLDDITIGGNINVKADKLTYGSYVIEPLHADIIFLPGGIDVAIAKARYCGVDFPGVVKRFGHHLSFNFELSADDQDLASTISCQQEGDSFISGQFDLLGTLAAETTPETLVESLDGEMELRARNGQIHRSLPLVKLFAYLEAMKIFRQDFSGTGQKGFAYKSILLQGSMKKGRFTINGATVDSPEFGIAGQGFIDFTSGKLDLDVLVAPMQKVNYLIEKTPLVGYIMGGTLVSIPVKISGSLTDPVFNTLPLKAVGRGLLDLMKRALKLPIEILTPN